METLTRNPLIYKMDYSIPIVKYVWDNLSKKGLNMCVLNRIMPLSLNALKQKQNQSDITK